MANRFPLIVDSVNLNIKELPSGDNIDLTGNSIYNNGATLVLPTASGTLATLAGTETLTNKTLSSGTLSGTFAGDATLSGSITLSATTALTIPVGTTAQRPTAATGQIRFNSSLTSFEGYNGTAWSSLGGVKSVDGFTYIIAETSSGASNGELEFYTETAAGTATAKQGGWNYTRLLTNTPIDFAGSTSGTTRIQATAAASGVLTLPAVTDTLAGISATQTLTNKTINLANNTLTATSAQIASAVSDETGSGSLVFGTSPSFTTSVLTGSTSFNVFNTTATTINAFGAATTLSLGASTGTTTINNDTVITGNLTVNGTTTTINSTTLSVDDILVELGTVATPTDTTAAGGGIVLKGATDKSITWGATNGWTSTEEFNLASGKTYKINGTTVLNATTLGSGVTASSLTSVGTITTGTWSATNIALGKGGTNASLTAVNGGVVYSTASAMAITAAGTAGQALLSAGAAAPVWTTLSLTDLPDAWVKKSVRVATTANITLSGTQTIDGIAVVAGDRVLVKDQTTASQNGIYVVAAGAWSRSTDADTISEIAGALVNVDSGTVNGGIRFDTDLKATDTLGTTAINFYKAYDTNDAATANTASKLVLRDASGNFSAGTITAALSGNASTATTLQTARNINGVSFNGSADITITAAAGTLTGTALNSTVVSSSLTSVGTITSGTWSGSFGAVSGANLTNLTAGNLSGTIPSAVLGNSTAYVGTTAVALNRASANLALTGISSVTLPGSTSGSVQIVPTAAAGTGTVLTLPATTGTVVTTGDSGTVTNTMLAGSIANAKLANSTISGVALGSNLNTLTLNVSGTGLSGSTTYNGSAAATFTVTSNATSANTASAIVARDANGDFSAGTITAVDGFQATSAAPFFMNATTVSANFTIPANYNAMSAGPVTINDGVTVTVPDGSVWTIV